MFNKRIALRSILAWAAPLVLAGCPKDAPKQTAEVIRPVRTQVVRAGGAARVRRFSGVTQASSESKLSFKVAGTLRALKVKVGQRVKKDQVIARLDDRDFRLQVQQAQAAYAQGRAQRINARAAYARAQKLYESSSASRSDLEAARAGAASARASVAAAAKRIELARSQLAYTTLKAPAAGAISLVGVELGENVAPGHPVAVLSSGGRPEVKVTVPEAFIAQIKQGAKVTVTLSALKGAALPATVTEVGVSSGAGSVYTVIVSLAQRAAQVRPGMAAEVAFSLGAGGAARVVVPAAAVSEDRSGRHVFVAQPGAKGQAVVRRRAVKVGQLTTRGLEISEGLKDGELLITAGMSKIRDGLVVKLQGKGGR